MHQGPYATSINLPRLTGVVPRSHFPHQAQQSVMLDNRRPRSEHVSSVCFEHAQTPCTPLVECCSWQASVADWKFQPLISLQCSNKVKLWCFAMQGDVPEVVAEFRCSGGGEESVAASLPRAAEPGSDTRIPYDTDDRAARAHVVCVTIGQAAQGRYQRHWCSYRGPQTVKVHRECAAPVSSIHHQLLAGMAIAAVSLDWLFK